MSEQCELVPDEYFIGDHFVAEENVVNLGEQDDNSFDANDTDNVDEVDDGNEDINFNHPLRLAICKNESEDFVLELIKLHPNVVQEKDKSGEYLLHKACRYVSSNTEIIMTLMEIFPPAVKQQNKEGDYPLHIACRNHQSECIVMTLIQVFPFAVQQQNNEGRYPFHIACMHNQSEKVVLKLIQMFPEVASINLTKIDDFSRNHGFALHMACKSKQSEAVIRQLIEIYPLAFNEHDCDEKYPIDCVMYSGQSMEVIGLIRDADPVAICRHNRCSLTPLHCAMITDSVDLAICMAQNSSIPINTTEICGMTPLHFACWLSGINNSNEIFETLLKHPYIDVNARDNFDITPLHKAATFPPSIVAVKKLLDHPFIVINPKDNYNKTPLNLIQQKIKELQNLPDENAKVSLELCLDIEKEFEEFPVKRRWHAYSYFLNFYIQ